MTPEVTRLASLTPLTEDSPQFTRLLLLMQTIRALRYRPLLWRQGAAKE